MSGGVVTVTPDMSAVDAWEQMRTQGIHHLVVCDADGVVGLLSARDIGGRHGASVRAGRRVGDLMTARPLAVRAETPVRRAANLMRGRSIGALIVENDEGRLTGIVTVSDLLDAVGRGVERPGTVTERPIVNHRVPHRKRQTAAGAW
jgi:CBS domain-containing protein